MKVTSILGKLVGTFALAGAICMLPVFSNEIWADSDPVIFQGDGVTPAQEGTDYSVTPDPYENKQLQLISNNLTICNSGIDPATGKNYPIVDACSESETHTYTIKNLTQNVNTSGLQFNMYDAPPHPVKLYVEGTCSIKGVGASSMGTGITANDLLKIIPKNPDARLEISGFRNGISLVHNSSDLAKLILGDENGTSLNIDISSKKEALSCDSDSQFSRPLKINKGVSLSCKGGELDSTLVDYFSSIEINGKVSLNHTGKGQETGALKLYDSLYVDKDAEIKMSSNSSAILNETHSPLNADTLGLPILGTTEYTTDASNMTEPVEVEARHDDGPPKCSKIVATGDIAKSLIIKAKPDTCTVTFDSKGGSSVSANTVIKGEKVSKPEDPTKDGYNFAGWYSDSLYNEMYDFDSPVNADITLYAKWTEKSPDMVTVTFDSNGGSSVKSVQINKGEKVSKPSNPKKDGYSFAGWYLDKKCTEKYNFSTKVENDITLYAKWNENSEEPDDSDDSDDEDKSVDLDTFKSEYPAMTVIATNVINAGSLFPLGAGSIVSASGTSIFDMKVHSVDAKTLANQKLLAQTLAGAHSQIFLTESIYPRRDLTLLENGSVMTLTWNNLPKNQPGQVGAVVYNQIDGAYVINGILDANGTATFTGFKLRPASTITICK